MQITNLKLQNFRSHIDSSFDLSRVNVIRGLNGAGKSSIQMALELLLTGKCDVTDQAGRGAQALITSMSSELVIEATLSQPPHTLAPMTYRRSVSGGQLVIGPHAGQSAFAWLEANVAPIPVLASVLNAHRFIEMNAKEQKALLAGALAADPVEIEKHIQDLLRECGAQPRTHISNAVEVDNIHKYVFSARAEVNRNIKALGELEKPERPDDMPDREWVTSELQKLQDQRDGLVKARAKKQSDYLGRKERLEAAKAQKAMYEPKVLSSDELDRLTKSTKNRTKAAKLDKEIAELSAEINAKRDAVAGWKNRPTNCEKCGAPLALDANEVLGKIRDLEAQCAKLEPELESKRAERLKLGDPELAQQKLNEHARAQSPYLKADDIINQIGELGSEPDVTQESEDIAELDHRISRGREIERQIVEFDGRVKQYQQDTAKVEKLRQQSSALDCLVEYFSDRGSLKAKLVDSKMPAFRARINEVLNRFGYECEFEMDPYILTVVQIDDRRIITKPLHLEQLSESEQYRFGIAFSIAMAEATGVGIVVIDRSDMLSAEARQQLTIALLESSLDQAFVLCTGEPLEEYPEIDGVRFFELSKENGFTRVTAQEGAHAN